MEDKVVLLEAETKKQTLEKENNDQATRPQPKKTPPSTTKRKEPKALSSATVTPNYDMIEGLSEEEEKIVYKIEKEKPQTSKKARFKKMRLALFCLVIGVCLGFGITNIVETVYIEDQYSALADRYYNLNLPNYLSKLVGLDTAGNYQELFETYPNQPQSPSSIAKSSNWFDRLCNFISRLFGG